MLGISTFGMVHTVISLIAVGAGVTGFINDGRIATSNTAGKTYVLMTILSCVTSFFIFHHNGKFGPPHVVGILTLVALAIGWVAGTGKFGTASRHIETLCYSMTFFFHMIPTITEGLTRLPPGNPVAASQDAPIVKLLTAAAFALFLFGVKIQFKVIRGKGAK